MQYYLSSWNDVMFESTSKVVLGNGARMLKYVRHYNNTLATFYTDNTYIFRIMYIYTGEFLYKTVLSYMEIKNKCSNKSIKAAFEQAPTLYNQLNSFLNGDSCNICIVQSKEGEKYCITGSYCTLFSSKRRVFYNLSKLADIFRNEIQLIKPERLEPCFAQKLKRFFSKAGTYALKFVVRAGVVVVGSAIGANLDLPDFDFDLDTPDINNDFDFDLDTDDTFLPLVDSGNGDLCVNLNNSDDYNVSFGSQKASLDRVGRGLGSVDVTITKEPGSSNLFCISDGTNTIHDVKGGTNFIKIDGIKYHLPKLKG